jgi:hypothetical protein
MVDHDIWWGNQDGFGMRKGVIPILPVIISDSGRSHSPVRHGLNEQKNVGFIHGAPPNERDCKTRSIAFWFWLKM